MSFRNFATRNVFVTSYATFSQIDFLSQNRNDIKTQYNYTKAANDNSCTTLYPFSEQKLVDGFNQNSH